MMRSGLLLLYALQGGLAVGAMGKKGVDNENFEEVQQVNFKQLAFTCYSTLLVAVLLQWTHLCSLITMRCVIAPFLL